ERCESSEMLRIEVLDIQKKELAGDFERHSGSWDQSHLYKLVYHESFGMFGGQPFGCLVADYYFSHRAEDVQLLRALADIGFAAQARFLAGAAPALFDLQGWHELHRVRDLLSFEKSRAHQAWRALRESESSRFLCLTLPGFLGRLPYG